MATDLVTLERDGPIGHIVLNRPEKRNALNLAMWQGLHDAAVEADGDSSLRVVIVRGVDATAFAAGADIEEFYSAFGSSEAGARSHKVMREATKALGELSKPTIARIQGPCIGGGCAVATYCDFRFADGTATFGVPPGRLGLVYSLEDTKRLIETVGPGNARHMLFTASVMKAEEAHKIGLVDRIFHYGVLAEETQAYAEKIAKLSGFTMSSAKQIIRMVLNGEAEETDETLKLFLDAFAGEDFAEGRAAFMEKRKPEFR